MVKKYTMNVMCSKHPERIPAPPPWSMGTLSSTKAAPGAQAAGDCCQPHGTCGWRDCHCRAVPSCHHSGSPQLSPRQGLGCRERVYGRRNVHSVIKVTANMFVGKRQKQKLRLVSGNPFPCGIMRRDRQPINYLPGG